MSVLCIACEKEVDGRRHSITCDMCERWQHRLCRTVGWGTSEHRGFAEHPGMDQPGMKSQILNLIRSIRTVMRIPLIGINIVVIAFMLILG